MTLGQISMAINYLKLQVHDILCKLKLLISPAGTLYTAASPNAAAADTSIPLGAIFYFDGTDGGFPEGQPWVKTYTLP